MRLSRFAAVAAIPVWLAGHAAPTAAQSFDDRWSVIPKAHADPAPPAPETRQDLRAPPSAPTEDPEGAPRGSSSRSLRRVFSGKASYYSYSSGKTASGETFNRNELTAAHRDLPFGTRVRVTALATGKSVVVRITDRGPTLRSRVLDLSTAAARNLGIMNRGVTDIRAEVL
jgi:rare lipoprotein A (peptidoglycan hydrolase)